MGAITRDEDGLPALCGRHKHDVIRLLATKELRPYQIARRYGVTNAAITNFKNRHRREIAAVTANVDDEYASIWLANKRARIAELQEMADILGDAILELADAGQYDADLVRARSAIFKQASEELGQLPPRQQVVSATVTHTVEGYTTDELNEMLK